MDKKKPTPKLPPAFLRVVHAVVKRPPEKKGIPAPTTSSNTTR